MAALRGARLSVLCMLAATAVLRVPQTDAAEVRGRVTEAITDQSIPWVKIELDAVPADGTVEHRTETGLFGFFTLADVPPGTYRLVASHPAYQPSVTDISLAADGTESLTFALTRVDAEVHIAVSFQVRCVRTGVSLPNADVTMERWTTGTSGLPADDTSTLQTGADGQVTFVGLPTGYFRFTVERSGWDGLVIPSASQAPVLLITDHAVAAALKPVMQELTVHVTGYDPVANLPNRSLAGILVSAAGLEFNGQDEAIEPRTALTDENGNANFAELPPIHWRVTAKKLGYVTEERSPATFPTTTIALAIRDTTIDVELTSPYKTTSAIVGASVHVTGFEDSSTEGIERVVAAAETRRGAVVARFSNLIPGRYSVRLAHVTQLIPSVFPSLGYSTPEPGPFGYQLEVRFNPVIRTTEAEVDATHSVLLKLTPVPATITGVLKVSEHSLDLGQQARRFLEHSFTDLAFVEAQGLGLLDDAFVVQSVDADASGRFSAQVMPGVYGLALPSAPDYTGYSMSLLDPDTGQPIVDFPGAPTSQGWPYPHTTWNYPPVFGEHGGPMMLGSGARYGLTLRAHRKTATVIVPLNGMRDPMYHAVVTGDPTTYLGFETQEIVELSGKATLTRDGGGYTRTHTFKPEDGFEPPGTLSSFPAVFKDVPPGDYTVFVTLDHFEAPDPGTVTVPEWPDAGDEPADPDLFAAGWWIPPGDRITIDDDWVGLETKSPGPITVEYFQWSDFDRGYQPSGVLHLFGFVKRGHDDGDGQNTYYMGINGSNTNNSISGAPDGAYTFWWTPEYNLWFRARAPEGTRTFAVYKGGTKNNVTADYAPGFAAGLS